MLQGFDGGMLFRTFDHSKRPFFLIFVPLLKKDDLLLNMDSNLRTVTTADGSVTLFLPDRDETYHSVHGAETESMHVFIKNGLEVAANDKAKLKVLEIGFGTGLNALLALLFAEKNQIAIEFVSTEKYPLQKEMVLQLNYGKRLLADELFLQLHTCSWNEVHPLNAHFSLFKHEGDFREANLEANSYDVIFFDAFAPRVQPELWTIEVFQQMYRLLHPGGILVTYCAKGEVKRTMKAAGFSVERLPGPPGKREMTRARKPD